MSNQEYLDQMGGAMTADQVERGERMLFLRKTYSLVLLGIAVFVSTMMAYGRVGFITDLSHAYHGIGLFGLAIWIGSAFLVRMLARTPGIGLVGFLVYAVFMGIVIAPWAAYAPEGTVETAATLTGVIFLGLTAYVFITKQDFSWMGGALAIGAFALFGIMLCAALFGFHLGTWYSIFGALLFSGYLLYDTSNILQTHNTREAVPAAIELFVDIVMLFWFILSILNDD